MVVVCLCCFALNRWVSFYIQLVCDRWTDEKSLTTYLRESVGCCFRRRVTTNVELTTFHLRFFYLLLVFFHHLLRTCVYVCVLQFVFALHASPLAVCVYVYVCVCIIWDSRFSRVRSRRRRQSICRCEKKTNKQIQSNNRWIIIITRRSRNQNVKISVRYHRAKAYHNKTKSIWGKQIITFIFTSKIIIIIIIKI